MSALAVEADAVLALRNVTVDYDAGGALASAVDDVSLSVRAGEIVGLVGESGCGKSTLANAVMGLLPRNARVGGSVTLNGTELVGADEPTMRRLRGNRISMVFQDPMTSLDPTWSVGAQVAEAVTSHQKVSRRAARARAVELMTSVGIPDAAARYSDPPHRFSGGMRQRIVIAAALANDPVMLIADEPTTALDVTIQGQILRLISTLAHENGTAVLLITHDLGVVAQLCDSVGVMYAGQLVEQAPVEDLFARPRHPYTRALLRALPSADTDPGALAVIPGQVPDLTGTLPGCRFLDRCARADDVCRTRPALTTDGRSSVACWHVDDLDDAAAEVAP